MSERIYYRDPDSPGDVFGPVAADEFERRVAAEDIEPATEVSLDRESWQTADKYAPHLFNASTGRPAVGSRAGAMQPLVERVVQLLRSGALTTWQYLRTVGLYYWSHRIGLWKLFSEYATLFQPAGSRKEIRVHADDKHIGAWFDGRQWNVELPDCCVVCGKESDCDWNSEQRVVPNLVWPLWGPLGGLVLGMLFGLMYWNRWYVLLLTVVGVVIGYHRRDETLVRIRYRRCRKHLVKTSLPRLRSVSNGLVIGVGHRSVWRQFHYGKTALDEPAAIPTDDKPARPAAGTANSQSPSQADIRQTIPLADADPGIDLEENFPDLDEADFPDFDLTDSDEESEKSREDD